MKVVYLIPGKNDPNNMIFAKRQIEKLNALGVEVKTFYLESKSPFYLLKRRTEINKDIANFKPHIIHCQYGSWNAFFSLLISPSSPHIITLQGSDINYTPTDGFLKDLFARLSTHIATYFSDYIICVSSRLQDKLKFNSHNSQVVPNGINLEKFSMVTKNDARKLLGWDLSEKIILFNANNPKIKRLDIALEVEKLLLKNNPNIRLEILNGKIDPNRINFMLNASDCLLVCSNSEGSPTIVKEALACNLPIISNDVGDVSERLQGVFPSKIVQQNKYELAIAIEEILNLGIRSNSRIEILNQEIDDDNISYKIKKIYEKLMNETHT
jgi:glycosyltransferase involved in cell wall biosynthesis